MYLHQNDPFWDKAWEIFSLGRNTTCHQLGNDYDLVILFTHMRVLMDKMGLNSGLFTYSSPQQLGFVRQYDPTTYFQNKFISRKPLGSFSPSFQNENHLPKKTTTSIYTRGSLFSGAKILVSGRVDIHQQELSHEKNPALLSIESWLCNRDP